MKAKRKAREWAYSWTWMLEDGSLCYFSSATKRILKMEGPPSDGAIPVRVRMVLDPIKRDRKKVREVLPRRKRR